MSRHVLIPLGITRIEPGQDRVVVQGLDRQGIFSLPPYIPGRMDSDFERSLLANYQSRLDGEGSRGAGNGMPNGDGSRDGERLYRT